jgi:hypothetical protein
LLKILVNKGSPFDFAQGRLFDYGGQKKAACAQDDTI